MGGAHGADVSQRKPGSAPHPTCELGIGNPQRPSLCASVCRAPDPDHKFRLTAYQRGDDFRKLFRIQAGVGIHNGNQRRGGGD
jgi:hypothetical protein